MTKTPDGLQPPKQITKAERDARKALPIEGARSCGINHNWNDWRSHRACNCPKEIAEPCARLVASR